MVINETILRFHQTWQGHLQSKWKLDVCREHQLWRILQSAMVNYLRVHGMLPFCYFSIAMEKKTVATIAIGKSTFMGHFPWLCQIIRGINIYSLQWRSDWWFGTFGRFVHSVGNVIIPTDEVIFFRGEGIPPTRYGFYMDSMCGLILWIYWLAAGVSQRSWSVSFAKFNPTMGHGFGKYPILTTDIRKKSRAFGYDPRHPTVADLLGSWFLRKGPKQSLLVK